MPVKVKCSGCEKVINAPDAAKGKVVKCPQCQAKIKVPADDEQPAKKAAPAARKEKAAVKAAASGEDFLAGLDITLVEDKSARVCPACGTEMGHHDIICPKCKFNTQTGQAEDESKKSKQKGSDPGAYVANVWKDCLTFAQQNKGIAFRSVLFTLIFSAVGLAAAFMTIWGAKIPVKVFWGFMTVVTGMVAPGWAMFLNAATVKATLNKEDRLERVFFDFFSCVSLGMKFVAWQVVMGAEILLGLVGGVLIYLGMLLPGLICLGVAELVLLFLLPLALPHFAMPVDIKAWQVHTLFKVLGKTAKASLVCTLIFVVTNLPAIGVLAAVGLVSGNQLNSLVQTTHRNSQIAAAKTKADEEASKKGGPAAQPSGLAAEEPKALDFKVLIVPGVLWGVACICFGVALPYNCRSNGLLVSYCKRDFDLELKPRDVKYITKKEREKMKQEKLNAKLEKKKAKQEKKEQKGQPAE